MKLHDTRTPLARASWLGSAKSGVEHWWAQRVSAIALIPLTVWFAASIIAHSGSNYPGFVAWLRAPAVTILMVLLLIAMFHHAALGLQVIIEDYVHSGYKFVAVIAARLCCAALAVIGILAVVKIAFAG